MRDIIMPTIVLFLICTIVTLALTLTNYATKDIIKAQDTLQEQNAQKEVCSEAESFEEIPDLEAITNLNEDMKFVKNAYVSIKNGKKVGRVYSVETKGYGGIVSVSVGIDEDGKITGAKIVSHSETPGLGAKAAEEPFISQFTGLAPSEPLVVVKSGSTKPEEIDAVSGATITSKAVVKAVQAALLVDSELKKREGDS